MDHGQSAEIRCGDCGAFADAATIGAPAVTHYRAFRQMVADRVQVMIPPGTGLVIPTTLGAA
jgi:amidase